MSGQRPYATQAGQSHATDSWIAGLPGYNAARLAAVRPAGSEVANGPPPVQSGQGASQQAPGQLPQHQQQQANVTQLVYAGQQPYPPGLLERMAAAPRLTSALLSAPGYAGGQYRASTPTPQSYAAQLAPLSNKPPAQRPAPGVRPLAQHTAPAYQAQSSQAGHAARAATLPIGQSQASMVGARQHTASPVYISEEDRKVLPTRSIKRKAEAIVGDPQAEVDPQLEAALVAMADELITNSVAFACGLARRRKAQRLEAADVSGYLDRTWHLHIPGFAGPNVRPHRRYAPGPEHQERIAAVRKARTTLSKPDALQD